MATRLCAMATAGQALVASSTDVVRGRRFHPPLERLGRRSLKGFDEPMEVLEVASTKRERVASRPGVPLVGRDQAIAAIEAGWSSLASPFVLVLGEPGIGKTQLARAMAARDDASDVVWVAFDSSVADGFVRWCEAIDERAARLPVGVIAMLGRTHVERLAGLLPSVAERLPVAAALTVGEGDRERSFDALAAVLRSFGGGRALLVLDDIQWAGATAAAFLERLRSTGAAAVRVLATCRPPLPERLIRLNAPVVELKGLATDELIEVLELTELNGRLLKKLRRDQEETRSWRSSRRRPAAGRVGALLPIP